MPVKFQREDVRTLWPEVLPLLERHWAEVAHYPDVPLDIDRPLYNALEAAGRLRAYTARTDEDVLAGYQAFILLRNGGTLGEAHPHYRSTPMAQMDVLYLSPEYRGRMIGAKFIRWCDEQLATEGIRIVRHHLKAKAGLNYGRLLERIGYELEDYVYARRLGGRQDGR